MPAILLARTRPLLRCLLMIAIAGPLAACATLEPAPEREPDSLTVRMQRMGERSGDSVDTRLPSPSTGSSLALHLMAAQLAEQRGQHREAAGHYLQLARLGHDADAAAQATRQAMTAEDLPLIRESANYWFELSPNSAEPQEVLLRLALIDRDADASLRHASALVDGSAGGIDDGLQQIAQLMLQNPGDTDFGLQLMQQLVARYPDNYASHYALALYAQQRRAVLTAETEARKAIALAPTKADAVLLLAAILIERNELGAATELLEQSLARTQGSDRVSLRLGYAQLLLQSNQRSAAREQLQSVLREDPHSSTALYALGIMSLNDGNLREAKALFERLRDDPQRGAEARYQLAQIAEAQGRNEDALALYESVRQGDIAVDAIIGRARVLAATDRLADARRGLSLLAEQYPPLLSRMSNAEADLLLDAGLGDDALALYAQRLELRPQDAELLYGRALAYERLDRFDAAESDLRSILARDPDNAQALNTLGYLLTLHSTRYDEAKALIMRALNKHPGDPAIVDSLGWVEFRLGNLNIARDLLERAYLNSREPEIGAHFGEVLWSLGDRPRARAIWKEALSRQPDNAVLKETIERLDRDRP